MSLLRSLFFLVLVCASSAEFQSKKEWLAANPGKTEDDFKKALHAFDLKLEKEKRQEDEHTTFVNADVDKDGAHSKDEIVKDMMEGHGFQRNDDGTYIEKGVHSTFDEADKDKDGKVTLEEYLKHFPDRDEAAFKRSDANGDGVHTKDEALTHVSDAHKAFLEEAHKSAEYYIKHGDKNGDGKLSKDEKKVVVRKRMVESTFEDGDSNKDGKHSADEIEETIMKQQHFKRTKDGKYIEAGIEESFKQIDENNDGEVTLAEFLKFFPNKKEEDFKLSDHNGDGKHTLDEQTSHQSDLAKEVHEAAAKQAGEIVKDADKDGDGHISLEEFDAITFRDEL